MLVPVSVGDSVAGTAAAAAAIAAAAVAAASAAGVGAAHRTAAAAAVAAAPAAGVGAAHGAVAAAPAAGAGTAYGAAAAAAAAAHRLVLTAGIAAGIADKIGEEDTIDVGRTGIAGHRISSKEKYRGGFPSTTFYAADAKTDTATWHTARRHTGPADGRTSGRPVCGPHPAVPSQCLSPAAPAGPAVRAYPARAFPYSCSHPGIIV